jgi:hypothetical protein
VGDVGLPRLADRPPPPRRDDRRGIDASPQFAFGWVRVSPSALPGMRFWPSLRFTRVLPAHHEPYQLARPPLSTTTYSRPVP